MPSDFKLTEYGDLDFSSGDLEWIEGAEELAQLMQTKTLKLYGEDKYAIETGIKWFGSPSMYDHQSDDKYRELQLRGAYMAIPEITGIPILTISKDSAGKVSISFVANSIYGEITAVNE